MARTRYRLLDIALWLLVGVRRMHDDAGNLVAVAPIEESELQRPTTRHKRSSRMPWIAGGSCVAIGFNLIGFTLFVALVVYEVIKGKFSGLSVTYICLCAALFRLYFVRRTCNRLPPRFLRASLLSLGKCPACAYPLSPGELNSLTRCAECGAQWYFTSADLA